MVEAVTDFLWSYVLVAALVALGLVFTVSSRCVQARYFVEMFRVLGQAFHHHPGRVSSFQALALSIAGRVGAGNIAGVAVAITLGGPGAIFWMWVIGLIGMSTSFFECTLAQLFKQYEPDGTYRGGPAYYMTRGLKQRWLAILFSLLLLVTFGLAFVALQSYTASSSLNEAFGIPPAATGIVLAVVVGIIVFGGIKRISAITEVVVPIMAIAYILLALVVVAINIDQIPTVVVTIVNGAFGFDEAIAGGFGAAIKRGAQRGLFSNEAGLGSAPNVAAVAWVPHPVNQGIVQALSVFIDTMIICSATAFIVLTSSVEADIENGVTMTQLALGEHLGNWGHLFLSVALLLFTFSSILYNYYLAENSLNYFSDSNKVLFNGFRILVMGLIFWGSLEDLGTIFAFSDLTMGLLALANLVALALLLNIALRALRDYDEQRRAGKLPVFSPEKFADLDLDQQAWEDATEAAARTKSSGESQSSSAS